MESKLFTVSAFNEVREIRRMKTFNNSIRILLLLIFFSLSMTISNQTIAATKPQVDSGRYHSVGLKSTGSLLAVGGNSLGQCNVTHWGDEFVQIAIGDVHTVGLKSDGTLKAGGYNADGQCNISDWSDIIQISTGGYHTLGLKRDGSLVAVGNNSDGRCNVSHWGNNIIQVDGGGSHTVALKTDGKCIAGGYNTDGQCNVGNWSDIVQVSAGGHHTLGLKRNGTVVAVGDNLNGQCNVGDWKDIIQISAGLSHSLGLKKDGTVVAVGNNYSGQCNVGALSNIVQVNAWIHSLALKADGTVLALGDNSSGQCNVDNWNLGLAPPKNIHLSPFISLLLDEKSSSPNCPSIPNSNFESGASSWTIYSFNSRAIITNTFTSGVTAHNGAYAAWLGNLDDETSYIQQQVNVSSACPYLTFYYLIKSNDLCGFDFGYVRINGTNELSLDLCSDNESSGWVKKTIDLSGYAGESVSLQIRVETDSAIDSSLFIDNIFFQSSSEL